MGDREMQDGCRVGRPEGKVWEVVGGGEERSRWRT